MLRFRSILSELEAAAKLSWLERRVSDHKVAGSILKIIRRCVFGKDSLR